MSYKLQLYVSISYLLDIKIPDEVAATGMFNASTLFVKKVSLLYSYKALIYICKLSKHS